MEETKYVCEPILCDIVAVYETCKTTGIILATAAVGCIYACLWPNCAKTKNNTATTSKTTVKSNIDDEWGSVHDLENATETHYISDDWDRC